VATGGGVAGLLTSGDWRRFAAEPRRLRRLIARFARGYSDQSRVAVETGGLTVAGDSERHARASPLSANVRETPSSSNYLTRRA